jgi:FlaA1/EpsC-like NDP-sugar epimerase
LILNDYFNKYFSGKFISFWVILIIDTVTVYTSFVLAGILRFNFDISSNGLRNLAVDGLVVTGMYFLSFLFFRTHLGIIRYSSQLDLQKILAACFTALSFILGLALIMRQVVGIRGELYYSVSILIIQFLISLFLLSSGRFFVKWLYGVFINTDSKLKQRILIYGAGELGLMTKHSILNSKSGNFIVEGFIDDNPNLHGKVLEGIPIYQMEKVFKNGFIENRNIKQVIFSIPNLSAKKKKIVIDHCLDHNLVIKEVPPLNKWIHGELSTNQIKKVRVEDLLGREVILLDNSNVRPVLEQKTILVTGAAGSIGSEIARQIINYYPKTVIILDQSESDVYELENELNLKRRSTMELKYIIGDITNQQRMESIFKSFLPDIVFHAAAYKHVPLMESNPCEAIHTNVFGTKIVADLSIKYGVSKFVLVSTDKAINPTNVMGCTKRVAEMYINGIDSKSLKTQFVTTRFGNVLGSNGSVVNLFKNQIEKGGPITITHRDITRFFMTIPEAGNLVLEAGAMGNGGEIFVFDMGESIKIYDLAKKMIRLSGLTEGKDIEIIEIGLRPGEKLFEELLANQENTIPTHHPKILKAQVFAGKNDILMHKLTKLKVEIDNYHNENAVTILKNLVPEYKSNNSEFSKLDTFLVKVV